MPTDPIVFEISSRKVGKDEIASTTASLEEMNKAQLALTKQTKDAAKAAAKLTNQYRRLAFPLMTIGFLLGRTGKQITGFFQTAAKEYLNYTKYNNEMGKSVIRLNATFTLLKMQLIELVSGAFVPLLDLVIWLMDAFLSLDSSWQVLIAAGVLFSGVVMTLVGTLFILLATLSMVKFLMGQELFKAVVAKLIPAFTGLIGTLSSVGASIFAFLISPIGLVLAALTLFATAYVKNWGGLRDKTNSVLSTMYDGFKTIFKGIYTITKTVMTTILDGISIAWETMQSIFRIGGAVLAGDWDTVWSELRDIAYSAAGFIIDVLAGLAEAAINTLAWIDKALGKDFAEKLKFDRLAELDKMVNNVTDDLQKLIYTEDELAFGDLGLTEDNWAKDLSNWIKEVDLDAAMAEMDSFVASLSSTVTGVADTLDQMSLGDLMSGIMSAMGTGLDIALPATMPTGPPGGDTTTNVGDMTFNINPNGTMDLNTVVQAVAEAVIATITQRTKS